MDDDCKFTPRTLPPSFPIFIVTIVPTAPIFGFSARWYNGSEETMGVTIQVDIVNGVSAVFRVSVKFSVLLEDGVSATAEGKLLRE
jgi:hypothetical protein